MKIRIKSNEKLLVNAMNYYKDTVVQFESIRKAEKGEYFFRVIVSKMKMFI